MAQATIVRVAGAANSGPTAAFTSVTGRGYIVYATDQAGNLATNVTSTNGIIFRLVDNHNVSNNRISVWFGVCTAGASGTVTTTYGGSNSPTVNVFEVPTGTYIKQVAKNSGVSASVSATFASGLQSEAAVLLLGQHTTFSTDAAPTAESGYTVVSMSALNANQVFGIEREADDDNTPSMTLAGSRIWTAIAVEVADLFGATLSYVGQGTGTTSATLPSHQAGDLIVVYAFRDGNATAPTLPAGWTNINTATTTSTGSRLGFARAMGNAETSGTWTNATSVVAHVYRGVRWAAPVGGNSQTVGTVNTAVGWGNITLTDTGGTSWVSAYRGHRSVDTALETAPTGLTARSTVVDATDEAAGFDTNGTVAAGSSWAAPATVNVGGTASGWTSQAVELRVGTAETAVTLSSATAQSITATSLMPQVTTNKNSGTLYYVVVANGDTPSVAQIKAGQNSSSAAAIAAGSKTVTASGPNNITTASGLTAVTAYDVWYVHTWNSTDSASVKADVTTTAATQANALYWAFP